MRMGQSDRGAGRKFFQPKYGLHGPAQSSCFRRMYAMKFIFNRTQGTTFTMQLAVDPMLRRQDLPGNIYVFNLSLTPKGPELYRWLGPRLEATADFVPPPDDVSMGDRYLKIEQRDNGLLYDLRLPWSELAPVKPDCNTRLGIYLIFMNNNGHGLLDTLHWPVPVPGMWTVPKKWGVLSLMS